MKRRAKKTRPLAPLPRWADRQARDEGCRQQLISRRLMAEFDRAPPEVRAVEHATGNLQIARRLVQAGYRTAQEAEPVVRGMLERRWGTGRRGGE